MRNFVDVLKYHHNHSYFCLVNVNGCNLKKKKTTIMWPIPSVIRPIPHEDLPALLSPTVLKDMAEDNVEFEHDTFSKDDSDVTYKPEDNFIPQQFSEEWADWSMWFNLLKEPVELFGSWLKRIFWH